MKLVLAEPIISGLRVAGPAFFLSMQASSIRTALKIQSEKNVGDLSPIPFISLLTNCIIWTYYGALRADMTVFVPNAIGIAAGSFGVYSFHKFSTISGKVVGIASLIVGISTLLAVQGNFYLLGLLGCILAVVLSGSPLATLQTVLRTKSTASVPFLTSLATWLNSLSWMLYGSLVAHDPMIYGPNSLGLGLASMQLALFGIYGFPKSDLIPMKVSAKTVF